MEENQVPMITVDDIEYRLDQFSKEVQNLIGINRIWEAKAQEAKIELARSEAALRELNRELIEKLKTEIAAMNDQGTDPVDAPVEETVADAGSETAVVADAVA